MSIKNRLQSFLIPLFTAILALGKHDGNMLFGESDITWDELENVTDGYFDGFAKEDCQIKAAALRSYS